MKKTILAAVAASAMFSTVAMAQAANEVSFDAGDSRVTVASVNPGQYLVAKTVTGTTTTVEHFVNLRVVGDYVSAGVAAGLDQATSQLQSQLATAQDQAAHFATENNAVRVAAATGQGVIVNLSDMTPDMAADGERGVNETVNRTVTTGGAVTGRDIGSVGIFGTQLTGMSYRLTINGSTRRQGDFDFVGANTTETAINILNELGETFDHGYELGYGDGWADGYDVGYEDGYDEGYTDGFNDGVQHGLDQAVEIMNAAN